MSIKFSYTGSEALEIVKYYHPKGWPEKIEEGKKLIKAYMRLYKCDAMKAYERFRRDNCEPNNAIITLAALHVMNNDYREWSINKLQDEQLKYGEQLAALENSTGYFGDQKAILRGYYVAKQNELQARIDELTLGIRVIEPQTVGNGPQELGQTG